MRPTCIVFLTLLLCLKKKNLHLIKAAKNLTEKILDTKNCPTETTLFIDNAKIKLAKNYIKVNKKNIVIGVGSSGPTTKWGIENYMKLLIKLKYLNMTKNFIKILLLKFIYLYKIYEISI